MNQPDTGLTELRAERDALEARAQEAERIAEQLADQLAQARTDLAAYRDAQRARTGADQNLDLFQAPPREHSEPTLAADGSDQGVLPMALTGVAVVAFMVALLSWVNSGFFALFTIGMLVIAGALAYFAWQTRIVKLDVQVSRGIVYIESGGFTHRFDLRSDQTAIEVQGSPGDAYWQVRFLRRSLDPFVIDTSMVDAARFMAQLREWRPEL